MSKNKKESFFWTSYSDLMTSLFFVMLVLFVLTVVLLHKKLEEVQEIELATRIELDQIKQLNKSIENIDPTYFSYNERFKRHTLKDIQVSFEKGSSNIMNIPDAEQKKLIQAGIAIQKFIKETVMDIPDAKYILIVEGQSSKDFYTKNYELSYERALSLVRLWTRNGINFDETCEVIISGSGQYSSFRLQPDDKDNKNNQRFVIHILPKPGVLSQNK